ncbi:MAG: hypothetical protein US39_C0017G0002 [Microgenomates group bacterium GW2011_GWC1_37_12b]|uniref:Uncharacterized protein n=1 Tax=Candidatus Woesebacteria bacterium GW2011_GWB1_38_8b TaxID=1618571 RepID=A0A0G0L3J0_9BACT|nr:MAG: hypothetical protein US39_C0017G0002 [Microgenomates group bacterium GW2011_GWC1_37_12b]KKQ86543.1 MAG: hypothetical protein UT10_C0022G0004 [Candidatus Woesebacteria bacterium GW2011_GWB1_38_8b]
MKSYIKSKSAPNAAGPGFRTSDHFKGSLPRRQAGIFSGGGSKFSGGNVNSKPPQIKFNPAQFKTQHKG